MRERNLARLGAQAAADQRRHAGRMMRCAERARAGERAFLDLARHRGDHRNFEQFRGRERRQDRGEPRRQHRLSGARRPDHQEVMSARGRDLQCALRAFLSLDVLQVERRTADVAHLRLRAQQHLCALHVVGELDERPGRDDLHLGARPRGLGSACVRTDQTFAACVRADRCRQYARNGRDRAVEPEFAQHRESRNGVVRDGADRRHQAERNRQVEMAAFLRQVGRRHVDGDAACGERESRREQRGAHPLACLGHRLVGQPDHVECGEPRRDLHLHVDGARLDALERHGGYALDHCDPCLPRA